MKFDVFNTETKKWVTEDAYWFIMTDGDLYWDEGYEASTEITKSPAHYIPVYYKDDNGEKLRDGDVYISHEDTKYESKYAIGYDYDIGFYIYTPGEEFSESQNFGYLYNTRLIGNKYENPELLK